jgi:methionyl-tRNA synthetase
MSNEEEKMTKETISYNDFQKMDIRIALILEAEAVPKTDRLVKMTLDIGEDATRTVVAGIREFYDPRNLAGKKVAYLANLAPRKLRGIESTGMVLAAVNETEEGGITALSLLETYSQITTQSVKPGAEVG